MTTVLQELILWTIKNASNVESQAGINHVMIDYEEMRIKFNEWLEKEKNQVINAYDQGINEHCKSVNGTEYYIETFNGWFFK